MKTSNRNINKRSSGLFRKIRNILVITLIAIVGFMAFQVIAPKQTKTAYSIEQHAVQQKANNDIARWQNTINQLKAQLNKDASINVLQGQADINITYTNKDIDGKGNSLGFLQKKFTEWQSKSLTVNSSYKFGFAYDLSEIQVVDFGSGNIKIKLSQNNLDLKYVEEITDQTTLDAKVGIFSKKFTPQEVQAIKHRNKTMVANTLQNKRELRDKATEYLQEVVSDMSKQYGFKNIEIEVMPDYLLDNTDATIINITYNN